MSSILDLGTNETEKLIASSPPELKTRQGIVLCISYLLAGHRPAPPGIDTGRSAEADDPPSRLAALEVGVRLVDPLQGVVPGQQRVQLKAPLPVQVEDARHVDTLPGRAIGGAQRRLLLHDQAVGVDVVR